MNMHPVPYVTVRTTIVNISLNLGHVTVAFSLDIYGQDAEGQRRSDAGINIGPRRMILGRLVCHFPGYQ